MTTGKLQLLDDYLSGVLPDADAEAFEEALFDGAPGSPGADAVSYAEEALFFDEFTRAMRFINRHGPAGESGTADSIAALRARGLKIHQMEVHTGVDNSFEDWPADTDLVVTHLHVDVRQYGRVDVILEQTDGVFIKKFHDVSFDPTDGSLYALCEEPVARAGLLRVPVRARVLVTENGREEEIASFVGIPRT